jgi:hypothetical protein
MTAEVRIPRNTATLHSLAQSMSFKTCILRQRESRQDIQRPRWRRNGIVFSPKLLKTRNDAQKLKPSSLSIVHSLDIEPFNPIKYVLTWGKVEDVNQRWLKPPVMQSPKKNCHAYQCCFCHSIHHPLSNQRACDFKTGHLQCSVLFLSEGEAPSSQTIVWGERHCGVAIFVREMTR